MPTIDYRVETKQLVVGGKAVLLAFPVEKVIEFASGLIVLLDRPPLSEFDRNVLAVSPNGEIVWQIEKPPIYGGHFENPFCEIWFSKNGELLADTSVGATFAVDIKTGRITLRDFQRF